MIDLLKTADDLRDGILVAHGDEHSQETAVRAWHYVTNRIGEGMAKTVEEVKLIFASFADGFCTGVHRGTGTSCTR